jgi:hypothetical protein
MIKDGFAIWPCWLSGAGHDLLWKVGPMTSRTRLGLVEKFNPFASFLAKKEGRG